jgi:glycosyl-4,4'-diaponeurosporenoate acyltransferase
MPIELPVSWIVILNVALWPLIQIALAWGFIRMPAEWFRPPEPAEGTAFYEKWLGIKRWKDRLPDGGRWFGGGFAKSNMGSSDPDYLRRFVVETWRGELCHWCAFLFVPVFFLWNPWWGNLVMVGYAIAANGPCILAQRYNRIRMTRLLRKHQASRRKPEARSTG